MKRRYTQADVDRAREEYLKWDTFGAGSETAIELAKRLGIGRTTLYKWRDRGWKLEEGPSHNNHQPVEQVDLAPVVRYLTDELVEARQRVSQLEAECAELREVIEEQSHTSRDRPRSTSSAPARHR